MTPLVPGQCVYCLQTFEVRSWDHVMPRSWYPDTTPSDLERWQVPSCTPCNAAHGRNEEDLLLRLMMCFGNDDARAAGIPQRIIRSIDPRRARNNRDARARAARHRGLGQDMFTASTAGSGAGLIPNFG